MVSDMRLIEQNYHRVGRHESMSSGFNYMLDLFELNMKISCTDLTEGLVRKRKKHVFLLLFESLQKQ